MRFFVFALGLGATLAACARADTTFHPDGAVRDGSGGDGDVDGPASVDAGPRDLYVAPPDLGPLDPDAACATATASATVVRKPVDIVWVIDNSSSMAPAIAEVQSGLDAFAALIAARDLDYRVIVVSKRGHATSGATSPYPVCVPMPLASDADCHDGPRFFHESVNIRSTMGMEQLLGALDETRGYLPGETWGGDLGETSWATHLRPDATKTIVMVTDDNERMVTTAFTAPPGGDTDPTASPTATVDWFETMAAGVNPFAPVSRSLPVGLLDASRGGLFDGYRFDAIYGWGSATDDAVICSYPGGTSPPKSGRTYSAWVAHTGGVRAQICDGHAAWSAFFSDVATAVVESSRISCTVDLPAPPDGSMLDPTRINVDIVGSSGTTSLARTSGASACGTGSAWYYDDPAMPTQVILCPAACDAAQMELTSGGTASVGVVFGCMSRLI